ncbi:hypothetical protein KTE19_12580 [Lentilactobacillus sp. IMAU92037]|uniref:hypothetical protein n=1 Tax=Lentilactobacillus dabitei TaxID=2831523 RepID=UPI001C2C5971|nr:hypothetical protein [Lentilactobacillus dabitei]MBV0931515.1 hypothetical protein [Lentilactobacillus dabitei]
MKLPKRGPKNNDLHASAEQSKCTSHVFLFLWATLPKCELKSNNLPVSTFCQIPNSGIQQKETYTPIAKRFLAHSTKMVSRFDLLNALAPIFTNSPWFGTAFEYSMKKVGRASHRFT